MLLPGESPCTEEPGGLQSTGSQGRARLSDGTRAGFTFGILSRPPERSALCVLLLTHLPSQFLLSPGSEFLARPTGDSQPAPGPVSPGVWRLRALRSRVVLVKPQAGSGASCSPASGLALSILAHSVPSLEHLLMGDPKVSRWRFGKHREARLVQPQSPWLGTHPPPRPPPPGMLALLEDSFTCRAACRLVRKLPVPASLSGLLGSSLLDS